MSVARSVVLFLTVVASCASLLSQERPKPSQRDPLLLEVLTRVLNASGGARALAAVHDLTESGEITFYWGEGVKGPVTIRMLGANHFRLESDVPEHKSIWTVRNGFGFEQTEKGTASIPRLRALNLCNLTFPVGHAVAAVADSRTQISFVDIEHRNNRDVYRVRLSGPLGLVANGRSIRPVTKELIIDALTYDIVGVEDQPLPLVTGSNGAKHHVAQRQIEYGNFRWVNGVRLPFSIRIRLAGQKTTTILLNEVIFNSNLSDDDFGL